MLVHFASGYVTGVDASREVRAIESRLGGEYRPTPPLTLGLELDLARFVGARDERSVSSLGATLLPTLTWHFLRTDSASLGLELGAGGGPFAPMGRPLHLALDGSLQLGLGARLALRRDVWLLLGVRAVHHSASLDLSPRNHAFDGVAFSLGTGFGVWR